MQTYFVKFLQWYLLKTWTDFKIFSLNKKVIFFQNHRFFPYFKIIHFRLFLFQKHIHIFIHVNHYVR